jgi:hypothetical protein
MNCVDGIRPMMKQLAAVAERTDCAVVIVGHMNKNSGTKGIYRGLGSIDIAVAARSVLLVGRIKSDSSIGVMAQLKNSLAAEGNPIAFEIMDNSMVRWIGEYDITAEELLLGSSVQGEGSKPTETMELLKTILENGEMSCTKIYEQFCDIDVSKRTVDSAKKKLGIISLKRTDGWHWSLERSAI